MPENDPNSELDALFLDHAPRADSAQVARILLPYVRLYADEKEIITNESWQALNMQQKILVYLIARKALMLKGAISEEEEKATPSQIEKDTELKSNSIRPSLSKLLDSRLVRVDKNSSGYYVPDHALSKISQMLHSE